MISHLRTRYIPIITHYISPSHTQITCDVLCITCRTSAKQHKDGQRNELRRASCGEHVPSRGMLISVCNQDGRSMIFNTCFHVSQFSIYFWVVIYIYYTYIQIMQIYHVYIYCTYVLWNVLIYVDIFTFIGTRMTNQKHAKGRAIEKNRNMAHHNQHITFEKQNVRIK
jgi:hypothetical protein